MASRNRRQQYEEAESGSSAPVLILCAVALFGLAILLGYLCVATPQQGTAMGAIRDVMRGLGGSLSVVLPLALVWIGALCVFAARGRRLSPLRIIADALLILCLFTGVHMFFAQRIVDQRMTIQVFSNFVAKSYGYGVGGGALGALLCWPLYHNFGVAGGFLGVLLIAILVLTATGRVGKLIRAVSEGQEKRRKGEQEFDNFEEEAPRKPRRRATTEDPFADDALREAARQGAPRRKRVGGEGEAPRRKRPSGEGEAPARRRRAPQEAGRPERRPSGSRSRRLYNERLETPQPAPDAFDDFDRLEAEAILRDQQERKERKGFAPDRPSQLKKSGEATEKAEAPEKLPVVKADRKSNVSIDDLKIQPEAYEFPDEDEPPFDPEPAKKKDFPKLRRAKAGAPKEEPPEYNYPPIDLLQPGEAEDTANHGQKDLQKAKLLEETLQSFGISARLTGIAHGPAVTRFELQPAPGVKVSRITSLSDDIALNLAAMSVRIEAPIPGKAAVGVEIPNDKIEMVRLRDVLECSEAKRHPSRIAVGLGKDNSGRYIVADIAKMPHVLIAGQTGSGKSVCINAIITSILFRASPEEVKLILIDPKVVELSIYNDIPHLVCPVVTDPKKASSALDWAVAEMSARYKKFAERGVRDIKGYNKALKPDEPMMPQMVIIIDELADLMMVAPGEVEDSICRLAQLARAAGMHLVIATQRPSVNVITGIIKANIPTRIAFSVASQIDSRTMIDHGGAEKLLGNGDMLFVPNGMKAMRVQGAWVSDEEVHAIVEYIKQSGGASYDPDMVEHLENAVRTDAEKEEFEAEYDPKLPEAVDIALDLGQVSISMLQRKMRIGYARAGRIIDEMTRRGIVSEADGSKPRDILISREEAQQLFE